MTLFSILAGILFANLLFNFASTGHEPLSYENYQHYVSERLKASRYPNQIENSLLAGSKPTVVALVSFSSRSRTEILDCYLQQNLVRNGGLIDRVIFSPEATAEEETDWLRQAVSGTESYNLIGMRSDASYEGYAALEERLIPLQGVEEIHGSVGRSWKLAETLAKHLTSVSEPGTTEPLFLFINSETIYLSPAAIASMIYTQQTQPEYSMVQANVVNQQVLSWLHNKMGVVKPYRPETKDDTSETELHPPEPQSESNSADAGHSIFDELNDKLRDFEHEKRSDSPSFSWRASDLPLWTTESAISLLDTTDAASVPLLFGVPIDFQPPSYRHRWLPYDSRRSSQTSSFTDQALNFHHRPSLSTPITQEIFSSTGSGKWPWTLSTQQLYSFLEHLEEELDLNSTPSNSSTSTSTSRPTGITGLARYQLPRWDISSIPSLAPSLFLLSSSDLLALTPTFPFHIRPSHDSASAQDNEEPTLARWLASQAAIDALGGRGAIIDGHAIAARFLPGNVGKSEWLDVDGQEVRRGLEGTDLLDRFRAYGDEVGCSAQS